MGNPANDLADLLEAWAGEGQETVYQTRTKALGTGGKPNLHFWRALAREVDKIAAYETAVDELERQGLDPAPMRIHLGAIYNCVFAPDPGWGTGSSSAQSRVDGNVIANLRLAAHVMEGKGLGALGEDQIESVRTTLREARNAIRSLSESDARGHLLGLIDLAIEFADHADQFGDTAVRQVVNSVQLEMEAFAASEEVDETFAETLRRFRYDLVVGIVGNVAANYILTGVAIIAPHAIKAIGG